MPIILDITAKAFRRLVRRRAARREYRALGAEAIALLHELYTPAEPATVLRRIADVERKLVELHPLVFGPTAAEGGAGAGEAILAGTELVDMLATTEEILGGHRGSWDVLEGHLAGLPGPEAGLWRRLAATPGGDTRADLIYQVSALVDVRMGEAATETLRAVADITWDVAVGNPRWSSPRRPPWRRIASAAGRRRS